MQHAMPAAGHSRRVVALLLTLTLVLTVLAPWRASASELDNRPTVTYPSSDTLTTMTSAGMTIPSPAGSTQNASWGANGALNIASGLADSGYAYVNQRVDLATHDLSVTYNIRTRAWYGADMNANDYGSAFILHNDPGYFPRADSDWGMLGIYKNNTNPNANTRAIANSVAVEFDNLKSGNSADQEPYPTTATSPSPTRRMAPRGTRPSSPPRPCRGRTRTTR